MTGRVLRRSLRRCLAITAIALLLSAPGALSRAPHPTHRSNDPPAVDLFVVETPDRQTLRPLDPGTLADRPNGPTLALGLPDAGWSAAISADGSTLAAWSLDPASNTVLVLDARTGAERVRLDRDADGEIAALSRDGRRLVLFAWDSGWHLVDTHDGRTLASIPRGPLGILASAIDPDARRLYRLVPPVDPAPSLAALSDAAPELVAHDLTTGAEIGRLPLLGVVAGLWEAGATPGAQFGELWPALAVSPDGRRLAIAHADRDALTLVDATRLAIERTATLHHPTTFFERLHRLLPLVPQGAAAKHSKGITLQAAFSPDGERLYVHGFASTVDDDENGFTQTAHGLGLRAVDIGSGEILAEGLPGEIFGRVVPAPDGRNLYVAGPEGGSRLLAWVQEPPGGWPKPVYRLRRLDADTLDPLADRAFDRYPALLLRFAGQ